MGAQHATPLAHPSCCLPALAPCSYIYERCGAKDLGRSLKTLGVGFVWEALRKGSHGVKTQYNAISGAVTLMSISQDLQRQMQAGTITPEQVGAVR